MTTPDFDFGYYTVQFSKDGDENAWMQIAPEQRNPSTTYHAMKPGAYLVQLILDGDFGASLKASVDDDEKRDLIFMPSGQGREPRMSNLVPLIIPRSGGLDIWSWGAKTPRRAAVRIFADPSYTP